MKKNIILLLLFAVCLVGSNCIIAYAAETNTGFLENAVSNVGFPILCCAVMAWFIYQTLKDHTIIKNDILEKALNLWTDLISELQKNTESINDMCDLLKEEKKIKIKEEEEDYGD